MWCGTDSSCKGDSCHESSKLFLIAFVFGVSLLLASSPAFADIVNVTTATTLFSDNFEGLGTNVSHVAFRTTAAITIRPAEARGVGASPKLTRTGFR